MISKSKYSLSILFEGGGLVYGLWVLNIYHLLCRFPAVPNTMAK